MAENKVTIYTIPTCPFCKLTREYFTDKGIPFTDIDVSLNEAAQEEMIAKSGVMSVPVIEVNGKVMAGFNKEEIEKALF